MSRYGEFQCLLRFFVYQSYEVQKAGMRNELKQKFAKYRQFALTSESVFKENPPEKETIPIMTLEQDHTAFA